MPLWESEQAPSIGVAAVAEGLSVMADRHYEWLEENNGDWELRVDGEHFGVICAHRVQCWKVVWGWGLKVNYSRTSLDHAKSLLERSARATKAAKVAYNAVLEEADSDANYW